MKIFTAHVRRQGLDPDRDLVLVPEGFNLWALIFTALWALWHRLWLVAVAIIAIHAAIASAIYAFGGNPATGLIADIAVGVLVGLFANDLRRWKLTRQGFKEHGVVAAPNVREAERRFLDGSPDLATVMADGLPG